MKRFYFVTVSALLLVEASEPQEALKESAQVPCQACPPYNPIVLSHGAQVDAAHPLIAASTQEALDIYTKGRKP